MEKIRAIRMEPGLYAEERWIEPDRQKLEAELGGKIKVTSPRGDGVAVICRDLAETEVLPANRIAAGRYGDQGEIFCGLIYAAGRDKRTGLIRSLTDREFKWAMRDYGKPSFKQIHGFGLQEGEVLKIMSGLKPYFSESMPRRITVIKEYKWHILCRAHYGKGREFSFSINKASLLCGDTKARRLLTGEMLA